MERLSPWLLRIELDREAMSDKNLTMGGVTKRSAFVSDGEGVIRYAEVNDNPGQNPDFEAIQSILAGLS